MPAPYIQTTVEDQSTRVVSTGGVYTGIVIASKKGAVDTPFLCSNQTQFLRTFTPNERLEIGWDTAHWEAYNYLATQSNLWVVRACAQDALYGGCVIKLSDSTNTNISLEKGIDSPENYVMQEDDAFLIYGADQGKYNDDLSVIIVTDKSDVRLDGAFLLKVYKNTVLVETHTVSLNPSLKNGFGVNCYIETVLQGSNHIRALVNTPGEFMPLSQTSRLVLKGGDDGSAVTDGDRIRALKKLGNINNINLQLVMDGGNTTATYHKAIAELCASREDSCHGIISSVYEDEVNADAVTALKTYRNETLNANTRLLELYTPHQLMYDEFNDRYVVVSPSAYVAPLVAKHAQELGWHWAVAGYTRGVVNSVDVVKTFEPTEVNELSDNQINTIIKDPGSGNIIYDELTLLSEAKDTQSAHIARYIDIYLRPRIKASLKSFLFEFNDEQTRSLISEMLRTFMEPEVSARAIYSYRVVCDESNNTDREIQNDELNVWLYIKPTKLAKFIKLKIIVTPYSVNLESIEV